MLSVRTLKNINIKTLENFLSDHKVKGRDKETKAGSTIERYSKILDLLNRELKEKSSFSAEALEEFLFENLFYCNMNRTFLYKFNSFFASKTTDYEKAVEYIRKHPDFFYNSFLDNRISATSTFHICTTRFEADSENKLSHVHILIKIDTKPMTYGNTHIFSGVTIDIKNKIVLIKFGQNEVKQIEGGPMYVIQEIKNALHCKGFLENTPAPLQLNITSLNEQTVKNAIYTMFRELSKEAEEILDQRVKEEDIEKIKNFLSHTMNLQEVEEDYIEQIKAVLYQDIVKHINPSEFENGWAFRFHYQEGDHTRIRSNQEDHSPVYKTKSFWQLKQLIHKTPAMTEGGFHWYLLDNKHIEQFVEVKLVAVNDTMEIYHFFKNKETRKEKESFVLRKVAGYLS